MEERPQGPAEYSSVQTCWCRLWVLPKLLKSTCSCCQICSDRVVTRSLVRVWPKVRRS